MEYKSNDKRVIELEVMDDLEDSGVSSIALVDEPAIEKYFIYMRNEQFVKPRGGESQSDFMGRCMPVLLDEGKEQDEAVARCISMYEQEFKKEEFQSYTDYPESASDAAKRALAWVEENGWGDCGTPIGKARANQLANREPISEETIARMASFERHRQNSDTPYGEKCGGLMWDAWGGDAGVEWATNKLEEIRGEELSYDTSSLPPYVDQTGTKKIKFNEYGCPEATEDIVLNLENRQTAIEQANYGPLNPLEPNEEYWEAKADKFNTSVENAKSAVCGNCGFFVRTKSMLACIAAGFSETTLVDPYDVVAGSELGYCEAFDFKCAAARTCDAWISGGPIMEEKFEGPCWDGYEQVGTKEKDGKEVPNCVKMQAEDFKERPISRIPKGERGRTGSEKNKPGDTKTSRGGIEVSEQVEKTLRDKVKEHNEKNPQASQKADLGMLKAVWRRGAGAYSVGTPGRRGMTRPQWSMGRVNAFLKILSGSAPTNKKYTQDNDLLPKSHPRHSEAMSAFAFAIEKDQQILVGPAMVPDMEIMRKNEDTGETYYVKFSKETIAKIQQKFMRETRLASTNLNHDEDASGGSHIFESYIVEHKDDKANSVYKLDVPVGTWMVKMKVTDLKVWEEIKQGKYQGFSIEGNFIDKLDYEQIKSEKDLVESIMSILRS